MSLWWFLFGLVRTPGAWSDHSWIGWNVCSSKADLGEGVGEELILVCKIPVHVWDPNWGLFQWEFSFRLKKKSNFGKGWNPLSTIARKT